eukprot:GHUV01019555.1.p1 GENE.GHUV01019555.1~~GHUV01019555.1.p1  ORF type:complete len:316 (+),score=27.42 GHUV01019555.1:88-1035(+)
MACLNGGHGDTYAKFDVEDGNGSRSPPIALDPVPKPRSSRRCSLPLILSAVTLMLSIAALGVAIDASVAARRDRSGPQGVLLTTNPASVPDGYKAVNMFLGTGYFARLQPMLYPRSDHKTYPIGSTVYIVGGLTNAEELPGGNMTGPPEPDVLRANVAYNTYTQSSTARRDMPEPRFRFCGAVLDGQIYVVGGMNKYEAPDATGHAVLNTVLRYNPNTDTWTKLTGAGLLAELHIDCVIPGICRACITSQTARFFLKRGRLHVNRCLHCTARFISLMACISMRHPMPQDMQCSTQFSDTTLTQIHGQDSRVSSEY